MAIIRAATYEDKDYDSCGNTTIAVLEVNQISIPLCSACMEDLGRSIDTFINHTIFCHQCQHFRMSTAGWHYGGTCKMHNRDRDCMDTCRDAVKNGGTNR